MKKVLLKGILTCTLLLACGAFAACGNDNNDGNDGGDGGQTHTHALTEHAYQSPASCTENGNVLYWECTDCGKYFSDSTGGNEYTDKSEVIILAQHSLGTVEYKAPTCTENGNERYWECRVCHTCFGDAYATTAISKDEAELTALGHDYISHEAHNDQVYCNVAGWNAYHTCSRCNYKTLAGYFAQHTLRQVNDGTYACGSCGMDLTGTEGLEYTLNTDGQSYTVSGIGTATDTEIVIPCACNGVPITAIGENAFKDCAGITNVVIVSGVTSIGQMAFYGCASLEYIDIPATVTSIGVEAFCNCESLEYVRIPNKVADIDGKVFYGCSNLKGVEIPNSVTAIGDSAFGYCNNLVHFDFKGTKYNWDFITKTYTWDDNTGKGYLVYCADATLTAYGDNVTSSQAE